MRQTRRAPAKTAAAQPLADTSECLRERRAVQLQSNWRGSRTRKQLRGEAEPAAWAAYEDETSRR